MKKKIKEKKLRPSKLTDTNTVFARLSLLPSFLGVSVFFIIPFMIIIWYSFLDNAINKDFVFLQNYETLFKNNAFLTAAKNTLLLSAVAVPLAVVLSLGLASLLDSKIPCKSLFRTFFLCPTGCAHMAGGVPLSRNAERCNGGMVQCGSCGLDEIKQMYDSCSSAVFVEKSRLQYDTLPCGAEQYPQGSS